MTSQVPLGSLPPGSQGIIMEINGEDNLADRLREMGFAEGLTLEVQHESFLGKDPMVVQVGQMIVALRRDDANFVSIHLDQEQKG